MAKEEKSSKIEIVQVPTGHINQFKLTDGKVVGDAELIVAMYNEILDMRKALG